VDRTRLGRALDLDLPAVSESCPRTRRAVRAALAGTGVDMPAVDLAVSEAVTNVVLHAYRDLEPANGPGRLRVTLDLDAGGALVTVIDDGLGMTPRDDTPGLGLGLSVIASVCDDLDVVQRVDGTSVQMWFGFEGSDHGSKTEGDRRG
jgi:anti-sigma regulatory factor (Ser/Thr protein kinase)